MHQYYCLISPEGTIVSPFRWNGPKTSLPRFMEVQMLDESANVIPQPYPDPEEWDRDNPHCWVIDFEHLPGGWLLADLTEEQWEETQVDHPLKEWTGTTIQIRTGCVPVPNREKKFTPRARRAVMLQPGLKLSHFGAGGKPVFKVDRTTGKTEADFPLLAFTQRDEDRVQPVSPTERLTATLKNVALMALATQKDT